MEEHGILTLQCYLGPGDSCPERGSGVSKALQRWMGCDRVVARRKVRRNGCGKLKTIDGGAVAQLGARLDGIEEVVGSNPIGSTN